MLYGIESSTLTFDKAILTLSGKTVSPPALLQEDAKTYRLSVVFIGEKDRNHLEHQNFGICKVSKRQSPTKGRQNDLSDEKNIACGFWLSWRREELEESTCRKNVLETVCG